MPAVCLYQNLAAPVIKFCEPNLCASIVQPANAWSSLAHVVAGIIILYLARRRRNTLLWWLGPIAILIGIFSFAYHASYTFIGQMLDLGSMFLLAAFLIVLNLQRIRPNLKNTTAARLYVLIILVSVNLMYAIRTVKGFNVGILIFGILLAVVLALECVAWSRATARYRLGNVLAALLVASSAAVIWMLDYTRLWCNANMYHYLNGHELWHILTAASIVFAYLFYRQFNKPAPLPTHTYP